MPDSEVERWSRLMYFDLPVRTWSGQEQVLSILERAGLSLIRKGESVETIRSTPEVLICGFVSWSNPDLEALDKLMVLRGARPWKLLAFDIDTPIWWEEPHLYLPEAKMPRETPVLAMYRDGRLDSFRQGREALDWVEKL